MSFSLTTDQVLRGKKTVTRRAGWAFLRAGDLVRPVLKTRGLKAGEKITPLRAALRIVSVRFEPLRAMVDDIGYGIEEIAREGSEGDGGPLEWVRKFCASHKGCTLDTVITRIEFEYTDDAPPGQAL
jgi:hypothetical protein